MADRELAVTYRPDRESLITDNSKTGPVKLTPGYESRHSNSDLLSPPKSDDEPPPDRCNLLFLILLVHGIGTLMPWNMFITAKEYFIDVKLNLSLVEDTNSTDYETLKAYNSGFLGYIIMAAQMPNLLCNLMNLFVQFGSDSLGPRIAGSIVIEVFLFVLTVVIAMVDSSGWPLTFFYITIATVVFLSAAGGIYQNSIFGLAGKLPGKYTGAIVLGTNISGTLTSSMSILSTFASPSERTAAIYYFISALFILLLCLDTYFALPLLRIYRYYQNTNKAAGEKRPSLWIVFKNCWLNCLNVFICFYATLACFPGITADIPAIDANFPVESKYFVKVFCFLFFNMFAMFGNMMPIHFQFPKSSGGMLLPLLLRLLFIPFFIMCNYRPVDRVFPVIFNDYTYIAGMVLFALSHGYYSSLAMMYSGKGVPEKYGNVAAMMATFFLVLGIFLGGNSLFLIQKFALKKV